MEAHSWRKALKIVAMTSSHPSSCKWTMGERTSSRDVRDTTHNFVSLAGVTKCGLDVVSHNTFLELGDQTKVLFRGRAIDVPIVTVGYSQKINLTVYSLL